MIVSESLTGGASPAPMRMVGAAGARAAEGAPGAAAAPIAPTTTSSSIERALTEAGPGGAGSGPSSASNPSLFMVKISASESPVAVRAAAPLPCMTRTLSCSVRR
jgi:hypothetical protein